MPQRPRIFISYRHADSLAITGRLYDRLGVAIGRFNVFKDMENIPAGSDFRQVLNHELADCAVILVIIGRQWASITDAAGARRLDNPADFVRIEVETALARTDKVVIPILVDGATLPTAEELPASLHELPYRNALQVRNDPDFDNDFEELMAQLQHHLHVPLGVRSRTMARVGTAIGVLALLFGAVFLLATRAASGGSSVPTTIATALPSVATATIEPVAADEYMVLVADPEAIRSPTPREVGRFVADDLTRTLDKNIAFSKIRIRRYDGVITTPEAAQAVAEANDAPLIVWGDYTPDDVTLNVQMGSTARFKGIPEALRAAIERLVDLQVRLTDERQQSTALAVLTGLATMQTADGDLYQTIRTAALASLLTVTTGTLVGDSAAVNTTRAFTDFFSDPTAAKTAIDRAITLDPGNTLLYMFRAYFNMHNGDSSAALTDSASAARLSPPDWIGATYLKGLLIWGQADWQGALETFTLVVKSRPNDWFPIYEIGVSDYFLGNYADAAVQMAAAIERHPDTNFPYLFETVLDLHDGRFTEAQTLYVQTLQQFPDVTFGSRVIDVAAGSGGLKTFKALFDTMSGVFLAQYPALLETTTAALNAGFDRTEFYYARGLAECNLDKLPEADADYTHALDRDPHNAFIYALRASLRYGQAKLTDALKDASDARTLSHDPHFEDYMAASVSGKWNCKNFFDYKLPATAQP